MTENTNCKVSSLRFAGHKITLSENLKGPTAALYKWITVGKNKDTWQRVEGFYFASEQRRAEWIKEKVKRYNDRAADKANRAALKNEARKNIVHPYAVGDFIYDSWGYDQTNIDFYQVIEVKAKSVVLQEIGSRMVDGGKESGMSSNVAPDPEHKIGEPFIKPIIVSVWGDKPVYRIKSKHGCFSKYSKGEAGVYSSWYA